MKTDMKTVGAQLGAMTLIFVASAIAAQATVPLLSSDERVLFSERTHPVVPSGIRGGRVDLNRETRAMTTAFTKAGAGAQVNVLREGRRFDPIPYLGDACPVVEVTFRGMESSPENLTVELGTLNRFAKPVTRKSVQTQSVSLDAAVDLGDGWKTLRLPFSNLVPMRVKNENETAWSRIVRIDDDPSADIGSRDIIEQVRILGSSAGELEVRRISLVRLRRLSVSIVNPSSQNTVRLEIEGRVNAPTADVTLRLVDDSGKPHERRVQAEDGVYRLVWENPPVTPGKESLLQASVAGGRELIDRTVPLAIFGYLPDTRHVWLNVKGRDIMTSPHSRGGPQPFYAAGVGYAKNVIVRGYDEEVAAYCKAMGLNTIRLSFYTSRFNNRAHEPLAFDDITAFIDPVIDAAKRQNLYVILNDHSYFKNQIDEETARGEQKADGWTTERFELWVDRWVKVADHYKDEPYILGYELCNEPVCDPETARKWYTRCIDAIREVDDRHIIIVGTHHWSHARALEATWGGVADKIDAPHNNIVFSFHDYPLDNNPWEVQAFIRDFQAKYNVPVLCTEFGAGGKPEIVHREFQAGMLAMFAFERVGWMIWSLYEDSDRATVFPTHATRNPEDKTWRVKPQPNPGYWVPFVELWAPTARIMGSTFPSSRTEGGNQ